MVICQSCGIPMKKDSDYGTEKDGSKSSEYCQHCYVEGNFFAPDATLEEFRELCIDGIAETLKLPKFICRLMTMKMHKLKRWSK